MTDRKLVEETLRESEARFLELAEQSRTTHWEVDPQGLFTYVSDVSQATWGYASSLSRFPNKWLSRAVIHQIGHREENLKPSILATRSARPGESAR